MTDRMLDKESCVSQYNRKLDCTNLTFYDSTLRDGEQMAGVSFSPEQKLQIAQLLDEMRIPQIEVGFPACSENERVAIKNIVSQKLDAKILGLSRIVKEDLDHAIDCGIDTALLFVSCSDIQILHSNVKKEEIEKKVEFSVEYLKKHGIKPSFSTMDSTRGDLSFQAKLFHTALKAGARRLGITDTLGCISPDSFQILVSKFKEKINSFGYGLVGKDIELSVHCHNDFGLALANAISGVQAGATAVATTTMGIGERAGNVPTEQFVMAMKYLYGVDFGIRTEYFLKLAKLIAKFSKLRFLRIYLS
jgi:methanogen homocitrate synthase